MGLKNTEAVTLRTYPYREADRIVVFFTRDFGKLRGIARGARRMKSPFGSTLEPLSYVRVIFFEKENQELASINSCDLLESHAVHRGTLEGSYYCAYFAEMLNEVAQEGEANEKLFRLLLAVLDPSLPLDWEMRARYLETWLLRLEGVFPSLQQCGRCGRRLTRSSVHIGGGGQHAVCGACAEASDWNLGAEELDLVMEIFSNKISAIRWKQWSRVVLKNLGRLNSKLIQYHLEKPLKSGRFLKELDPC
jgi:DNA repair protein RecO (recombination protein O)